MLERIGRELIDSAIRVHRELGPGLLEKAYETCLAYELESRGIRVARQVELPVRYRQLKVDAGFRIDLLLDDLVVVELKSVERLAPVHEAQLLSYLRMSSRRLGYLLNFNVYRMKEGIKRMKNGYGQ
jgi:GxxExxY protein